MEFLAGLYTLLLVAICLLQALLLYRTGKPAARQDDEALKEWLRQQLEAQARVLEEKQAQQAQQNLAAMAHISDTLQTAVQGMSSTLTAGQNAQQQTMEQRLQGLEASNARKLEEMLIVWLIESDHLTSKERMFEVYLNIAEWGPMIYGAAEASRYYFAKEPSQLNLAECIFMASIIPKPKQVRYCFDGLRLKPYYEDFYRVILDRLVDRGLISSEEAVGVTPESVEITGPAKEYLTATQSRSPRSSQFLDQK